MKGFNRSSTGKSRAVLSQVVAVLVFISLVAIVPAVIIVSTQSEKQQQSLVATSVNPTSANIGDSHVNMTICVDSVGDLDSSAVLEVLLWYAGRAVFRARDARANSEGTEITCCFDFSKPDILPGAYHLSIYWRKAGWTDDSLRECVALVDPEHDSAEDGVIDSFSEIENQLGAELSSQGVQADDIYVGPTVVGDPSSERCIYIAFIPSVPVGTPEYMEQKRSIYRTIVIAQTELKADLSETAEGNVTIIAHYNTEGCIECGSEESISLNMGDVIAWHNGMITLEELEKEP